MGQKDGREKGRKKERIFVIYKCLNYLKNHRAKQTDQRLCEFSGAQ